MWHPVFSHITLLTYVIIIAIKIVIENMITLLQVVRDTMYQQKWTAWILITPYY